MLFHIMKESFYMHQFGWSPSIYNNIKNVWKEELDSEQPVLTAQPSSRSSNTLAHKMLTSANWTVKTDLEAPHDWSAEFEPRGH